MTPSIEKAVPNDIPNLNRMIRALCAYHGDPCPLGLADTQDVLIDGTHIALVARRGTARIGYAIMEPRWKPMHGGWAYDISHLYIVETERGKGVGRALIEACREHARAQGAIGLAIGTSPDNPAAAAAYRSMGLEELRAPAGPRFQVPM